MNWIAAIWIVSAIVSFSHVFRLCWIIENRDRPGPLTDLFVIAAAGFAAFPGLGTIFAVTGAILLWRPFPGHPPRLWSNLAPVWAKPTTTSDPDE